MTYRRQQGFSLNSVWVIILVNLIIGITTLMNRDLIISRLGLWPVVFSEQPWSIVTSMFVHASFWHIFANMLTLYFFGSFLSRLIGNGRFMLVYFGGGILGGILFLAMASPYDIAVGASGAVFALGGALAVLTPKVPVMIFPIPAPIPLWTAVIGGFIIVALFPHVAWQAHLGGIIFGLAAGYFYRRKRRYYF